MLHRFFSFYFIIVDARFAEDALLREFNAGDVDFDNFDTDEEVLIFFFCTCFE